MHINKSKLKELDSNLITAMGKMGIPFLRYSLGIIFIWFGVLKPLGLSPAQNLVEQTAFWFPGNIFIPLLGIWEVLIGVCFIFKPLIRVGILLLLFQQPGTFLPILLLPEITFTQIPFALTLEGQYIIKNLLILGAAFTVWGSLKTKAPPRG